MTTDGFRDGPRPWVRSAAIRAVLAILIATPACVLFLQVFHGQRAELAANGTERHGVAYLRALQPVIASVVAAETVAVRAGSVDLRAVDRAVLAASAVDNQYGNELRARVLWTDASTRIQQLHNLGAVSPSAIFAAYTDITTLLTALYDKIRESSGLIRDPNADLYYLEDGVARQLPVTIVASGQFASILILDSVAGGSGAGPDAAIAQQSMFVQAAADLGDDIQQATESSTNPALGAGLLAKLDEYRVNVERLATDLHAAEGATADASATQSAAATLGDAMFDAADGLLDGRTSGVTGRMTTTWLLIVVVVLGAFAPLLAVAIRRRPRPEAPAPTPDTIHRYAEGGPLPHRSTSRPEPVAASPMPAAASRELVPARGGPPQTRRSASPSFGSAAGQPDPDEVTDEWGRPGVPR